MNPTLKKTELLIKNVLKASDDSQNVFTPFELCDEVLDKVPSLDGHILVVSNLEFVYSLKQRGVNMNNVSYLTPCPIKRNVAEKMGVAKCYMYDGIPTKESFDGMKFDVVVGNPPYQHPSIRNQKLWIFFIEFAFDIVCEGGFVSLITPDGWTADIKGLYERFFISKNTIVINVGECGRHFVESIGFSYFVTQNTPPDGRLTTIITQTEQSDVRLPRGMLGNMPTTIAIKILSKTLNDEHRLNASRSYFYHTDYLKQGRLSKNGDEVYKHRVLHKMETGKTPTVWYWTNEPSSNQTNSLLIWSRPAMWERMFVSDVFTTQDFFRIPVPEGGSERTMRSVFQSKLFKFLLRVLSPSQRNISADTMRILPLVDLTRNWTDAELYEHFNLTQEEIDLIETTIAQ